MSDTQTNRKKTAESTNCDNDWCDGPTGETFPCFACYDPDRTYGPLTLE